MTSALVAPGLTGGHKSSTRTGPRSATLYKNCEYDLYYIKNQSLTLDMVIVFETVKPCFFGKRRQIKLD